MRTIAIMNFKGGVGKTVTTATLACLLAKQKKRVLAIDADSQGNLSQYFGVEPTEDDIMRRRHDVYIERADQCGEQYDQALKSYRMLLAPYMGKPLGDLPQNVLAQGANLERAMNEAQRKRMRLWHLANKCMDRVLGALGE